MTRRSRSRIKALAPMIMLCVSGSIIAACGSEATRVDLTEARGCLASDGYRQVQAVDVEGSLPGSVAPNLAMEKAGIKVEAIVDGDVARAQRRSADLRGALQSFGASDATGRVTRVENAVVIFTPVPASGVRLAVLSCFGAQ